MLKKLAIVLMLLSAPFAQVRAVMACAMMPTPTQARVHCCCEDEAAGPAAAQGGRLAAVPCCSESLQVGADPGMVASGNASEKRPLKKLSDHSPDPAAAVPPVPASLPPRPARSPAHRARPAWDDGSRTYLSTARLRL